MFQRTITLLVGRAVGVYHRVERRGPPLPAGPVLVVANHLNALIDPLVIFRTAGRPTRPLAKAPLFHHPLVGPVLVGLGGLPVFRPRDDPQLVHRNASTFDAAIEALRGGEAVQIYPEGQSHSGPSLSPLRTGAARIALEAEERAGWELGLRIVPVGLVYQRKHLFRGSAVAVYGEPLTVGTWHDAWTSDPRAAARTLTREIARCLAEVTLEAPSTRDRVLVETAEALHARGRGKVRERERVSLGSRVDRLRVLARGIGRLRAGDPPRYERLRTRLERYRRLQRLLGSSDDTAVPGRYHPGRIATYASRQSALLLLLGPLALVATVAWWIPYHLPRLVVRLARPALDAVSTYKL
ncbi:MAG: 1-acyl-sn-glycerol-3-phosphate acyltransferase, partial [Gemmatimonadota bacterium]